jgi:hypothetical protein
VRYDILRHAAVFGRHQPTAACRDSAFGFNAIIRRWSSSASGRVATGAAGRARCAGIRSRTAARGSI